MKNLITKLLFILSLILFPTGLFAQEAENLPPFIDLVYTYDGRGNVTSITDNIDSANNCIMGYDGLDRLITANGPWGKGTFTYDSQGNRTSKNIAGQIVSNTYTNNRMDGITHDANGNITNDGRLTYRYNSRNLITEVRSGDVLIESYKYDGLGRRIKRTDNAGKVTYYLYQGFTNRVLSELNGKGVPTVNYVYMGNTRVARVNLDDKGKEASREYYVPDHLGSNIAMTDTTSVVAWDKAYLPYGDTYDNLFPNQTENIHDYTGKELDEDTGLHYYGARYYNAKLGRFMSVDPVGGDIFDPQSFNKYPYVLNNPFKYVDPNGESPCDVASVFGGLAGQITGGTADLLVAYGKIGIRDSEFIYLDAIRTTFEQFETITSLCGFRGLGVSAVKLGVRKADRVGQTVSKLLGKGDKFKTRITRQGDKAVRIIRKDGSVIDISPKRVKEFTLSTNSNAPSGTLQRTKFEDALPGSKGFKRAPTQEELDLLEELTK